MAAQAAQTRPFISSSGNPLRLTYHSIDATDQNLYNTLARATDKNAFLQMVRDWKDEIAQQTDRQPVTGVDIQTRWNQKSKYLIRVWVKKRPRHKAAATAVPIPPPFPAQDPVITPESRATTPASAQSVSSPIVSPLAELSPRFVCQGQWPDRTLSPTRGQMDAIASHLEGNWKYGDVAFQEAPLSKPNVPMAPVRSVYLCVRPDEAGIIQEQIAVKCLEINEMTQQTYEGHHRHLTDLGKDEADIDEKRMFQDCFEIHDGDVASEVRICQRIALTRCSHIVQYRGHSVRDSKHTIIKPGKSQAEVIHQRTVHLYQSWAGRGDLNDLINRHRRSKRPINEHFIWYTLRELTEALIALKDGPGSCTSERTVEDLPGPTKSVADLSSGWVPILHLDIKADNILLEAPRDDAEYPAYPKPVLCDFGLSQVASPEFLAAKSGDILDLKFSGTEGWKPPERSHASCDPKTHALSMNEEYLPHTWPLSEKTDVWGLGLIAHKLMFAHHRKSVDIDRERVLVENTTLSNVESWAEDLTSADNLFDSHYEPDCDDGPEEYSTGLHRLVVDCLRHDMRKRPGLLKLRKRTQAGLARLEGFYSDRVRKRKRKPDDALVILTCDETGNPFETYEIGKKYRPKRKRPRLDLDENSDEHFEYGRIISTWDTMDLTPTLEAQDIITGCIETYLLNVDMEGWDDAYKRETWEWSTKHLITCLRKRTARTPQCFVLTHQEINKEQAMIRGNSEELDAFGVEIKVAILKCLHEENSMQTDEQVVAAGLNSVNLLRHVIEWASFLVRSCCVENEVLEPMGEGQEMKSMSELHRGFFDWIFVKPSGAFVKKAR